MAEGMKLTDRLAEAISFGVGPVTLDIEMARCHGWSKEQIGRAAEELEAISIRERDIAHSRGVVPACPCLDCDPSGEAGAL